MAPPTNNTPRLSFEDRVDNGQRELVLVKNGQRYVFRCAVGQEADMLSQLGDMIRAGDAARSGPGGLDWFDAAVISHQIGQRLADHLNRYPRKAS